MVTFPAGTSCAVCTLSYMMEVSAFPREDGRMLTPELTLQQDAYRTHIAYRFFGDHVEYTIVDGRGDRASFSVKYEDAPSRFDYRTFEPYRPVAPLQLCVLMTLALCLIVLYPDNSLEMLGAVAASGGISMGLTHWLRRSRFRKLYTSMPTRNGKLLILRDGRHDAIVREIETRRLQALRKYAMSDALDAPQAAIRRLRWLKEEGAINALEFDRYRRALGPVSLSPDPLPDDYDTAPLRLTQNAYRFHSVFSFEPDHLRCEAFDGSLSAFNVHYRDLPHPTEYRTVTKREGLAALVLCLVTLLGMALVNIVAGNHYYETAAGARQMLTAATIYVCASAFLVFGARRQARKEFTLVPVAIKGVTIRVLKDAQHDRIIGEMQNRRLAALRTQAVIDRANSPQGELRKFIWLKEQGAITDREFEDFRQRLMDRVSERQSVPSARPPSETLH